MLRLKRVVTIAALMTFLASACQPNIARPPTNWPQTVATQNIEVVGHLGGPVHAITIRDPYAYVGFYAEFAIFDLSNPLKPIRTGYIPIAVNDVVVQGDYAYIAGKEGLSIIAIADPSQPIALAHLPLAQLNGIAIEEQRAYTVDSQGMLYIVDVAQPIHPTQLASLQVSKRNEKIVVVESYAYLTTATGLALVDITDDHAPVLVAEVALPNFAWAVAVSEQYAYVSMENLLGVVDIADPAHPTLNSTLSIQGLVAGIEVSDSHIYLANGYAGLQIVERANAQHPHRIGGLQTGGFILDVALIGDYAYLADGDGGLHVIDVRTPRLPSYATYIGLPGILHDLAVIRDKAYLLTAPFEESGSSLIELDITTPTFPVPISAHALLGDVAHLALAENETCWLTDRAGLYQFDNQSTTEFGVLPLGVALHDIALVEDLAFVTDANGSFYSIDLHDANAPQLVGQTQLTTAGAIGDLVVANSFAYIAAYTDGLLIVDVGDPQHPQRVAKLDTPGSAHGIDIAGDVLYVADGKAGLRLISVARPGQPRAIGVIEFESEVRAVTVEAGYAFVATTAGLLVVDVRDPSYLTIVGSFDTPGVVHTLALAGDLVYAADWVGGLWVLRFRPPVNED